MKTILAIDNDRWACETYRANMPGVEVRCEPLRRQWIGDHWVIANDLPKADAIVGGPPCQGFSSAGEGKGADDHRNGWPAFIEAVRTVMPRQFLAENVPGMLTKKHAPYFRSVVETLAGLGYCIKFRMLDAANYGTPQFRQRVFVWGIRTDLPAVHRWPEETTSWPKVGRRRGSYEQLPNLPRTPTVAEALGLGADGSGELYRWSDAMLTKHPPAAGDEPAPTIQAKWFKGGAIRFRGRPVDADQALRGTRVLMGGEPSPCVSGASQELLPIEIDRPSPTLKAGGNVDRFGHLGGAAPPTLRAGGMMVRRLTPDECLRLQGGPEDWVWPKGITKTAQYHIVGNGWACPVGAAMGRAMQEADPKSETVIDLFCGGGLAAVGMSGRHWRRK